MQSATDATLATGGSGAAGLRAAPGAIQPSIRPTMKLVLKTMLAHISVAPWFAIEQTPAD
jgi:hypothetical protein